MNKKLNLWLSVITFEVLGLLSGIFAINAKLYYTQIQLPSFAPPGWIFGPVWTILYAVMGLTLYYLDEAKRKCKKKYSYSILCTIFS